MLGLKGTFVTAKFTVLNSWYLDHVSHGTNVNERQPQLTNRREAQ